ncbi:MULTISPECIES: DUF1007 family protein [unclassified Brenneria]|uniref:DUF1007 family protein n=1 Tax=unclassified Brenneria TaxID=2634434 RepID=UPI0015526459|nr:MULTISPECIES: DUF1007 family protein [unclassified Brenneria]MEE3645099.1 DUF1007 family protein [Brenneria sp. L3_3C_1]MEE3652742.1 DUF1007 family protein [Brenneria sp. HEZEL_4_2_4]MBJ7223854.1 DUF1007 family protein [Brenneria sp. L3-3C-1]MEE3652843.1 DUF1007 family protein [Brenneria sp. HEZEL_4_2_4]NPD02698.1 DUF1007 family protein [Brenneria sp. hezel4-2-4]
MLHYNIFKRGRRRLMLLIAGMVISQPVFAHPHSFIDMQTTVESQNERITGLRMQWTMDPITSADLLYDAGAAEKDSEIWKKLAAEVMANVLGQHYFTDIYRDEQPVPYKSVPTEYRLSRQGNQAVLEFVLPLAHPQPLMGKPLLISTYDPTYFVAMFYENDRAIRLSAPLAARCKTTLTTPEPNADLQAYALSLDKEDAPGEDMELGKQFAQRVTLQCH